MIEWILLELIGGTVCDWILKILNEQIMWFF